MHRLLEAKPQACTKQRQTDLCNEIKRRLQKKMLNNKLKLLGIFVTIVTLIGMTGCTRDDNTADEQVVKSGTGFAIPAAIKAATLPTDGTLTAKIYIDSNSTAAATQTVDVTAAEVTFTLKVAPGDHTFTIVFEYDDPVFNERTWELATATSDVVTVATGKETSVSFPAYIYADFDEDGLTNLAELDESMRTDPNNTACVLDSSVLDGCTLG